MASFDKKQALASINKLFKQLWPMMEGVGERYRDCLLQVDAIRSIVDTQPTHDARLAALILLPGIKATIGSGLLWSFFPAECVPFDKHTTGYCVMDWRIMADPKITNGTYGAKCAAIVAGLPAHTPPLPAIEDLVLWAAAHRTVETPAI